MIQLITSANTASKKRGRNALEEKSSVIKPSSDEISTQNVISEDILLESDIQPESTQQTLSMNYFTSGKAIQLFNPIHGEEDASVAITNQIILLQEGLKSCHSYKLIEKLAKAFKTHRSAIDFDSGFIRAS